MWTGTCGAMMVVWNSIAEPWRYLNGDTQHLEELVTINDSCTPSTLVAKWPLSPSLAHELDTRWAHGSSSSSALSTTCIAPPCNPYTQKLSWWCFFVLTLSWFSVFPLLKKSLTFWGKKTHTSCKMILPSHQTTLELELAVADLDLDDFSE